MGVLEIAGLINMQFPTCPKEKTKGIQKPTNMLSCFWEGDKVRKDSGDLGHELIWAIAWNGAGRRTTSCSCRASPWVNERS